VAVALTTALPVQKGKIPIVGILSYLFPRSETHKHQGIDFTKPIGTPVRSVTKGIVSDASDTLAKHFSGYGRFVQIEFTDPPLLPVWVLYAHLDTVQVKPGDVIEKGQQIGTVGRTCFNRTDPRKLCGGAHLHFEVRSKQYLPTENGRYDPVVFLAQHGEISPVALMAIKKEENERDSQINIVILGAVTAVIGYGLWYFLRKK